MVLADMSFVNAKAKSTQTKMKTASELVRTQCAKSCTPSEIETVATFGDGCRLISYVTTENRSYAFKAPLTTRRVMLVDAQDTVKWDMKAE